MGLEAADMPYYSPQERRTDQLNVRVTPTMKRSVEGLSRLWTHMEQERAKARARLEGKLDSKKLEEIGTISVTTSDVVVRLLGLGLPGAWDEFGAQPKNEDQWKQLLAVATKHVVENLDD